MDRHCGQCEKPITGATPSRFYFEDDSWLCTDCFGNGVPPSDRGEPVAAADRHSH